jgi:hypothetical protein
MNELIFILHTVFISLTALGALYLGQAALVAFVCLQCVLANLFVIKQITLFSFTATCSDAFTIGSVLGLNLLQEYYGREITRKTIWINFILLLFYAVVSQIRTLKDRLLIIRNYASIVVTQLLDTVLFTFLGLYGIIDNLWEVVIISYSIKLLAIVVATPFVGFSRKIYELKK